MGIRPNTVTQEEIDKWELKRKDFYGSDDYEHQIQTIGVKIPLPSAENFYANEWLAENLEKLNCPEIDIKKICFACGQYQSQLKQDWEPAIAMYERYRDDGTYEEPGETLAFKLFHMVLGPNPEKKDIIKYICENWGIKEEQIDAILFKFMVEGFPKAPDYVVDQKPRVF